MPSIAIGEIGPFISAIPPHAVRLLAGLDAAGLADALGAGPRPGRPVLALDLSGGGDAGAIARAARDGLARAVAGLWPFLWGGEDLSDAHDDALTRAHLPIRLARLAGRVPALSQAWALEAAARLVGGRGPCRPGAPDALDWEQLVLALAPGGLVVATPLPAGEPNAVLAALAWLAERAAVSVLVLAPTPPDPEGPFGRVLFGAGTVAGPGPVAGPEGPEGPEEPEEPEEPEGPAAARVLAEPEVEGRPHPLSAAEMRLHRLIRADAELAPLFAYNRVVPDLPRLKPRVDLLWAAGRVVVEIDGPEHRAAARYRADRQRDADLMCAGYRVLRLTNADVIDDAGLALARIRDVVRLSGSGRRWATH